MRKSTIASGGLLKKSVAIEVISLLFVILFLYTGISKLMEYGVFKEQLAQSPVLKPIAPVIAWGLPLTELAVAVLTFIPNYRLSGLYVSLVLMVLFTGYIIAILSFSKELPCSCGGVLADLSWPEHLVFNGSYIALALTGILLGRQLKAAASAKETSVS